MSDPPLYFRGMLQRIACINWKALASLSPAEIKKITSKTNRFLLPERPKPVEKAQNHQSMCTKR
jgi:hypothetical protein